MRDNSLTSRKDGIGPEVVDAAITVLKTLSETLGSFDIDFTHFDWSSDTYKKTGKYIPDGGLEQLKKHDAILFGAVGAPGEYQPTTQEALALCLAAGREGSLLTSL